MMLAFNSNTVLPGAQATPNSVGVRQMRKQKASASTERDETNSYIPTTPLIVQHNLDRKPRSRSLGKTSRFHPKHSKDRKVCVDSGVKEMEQDSVGKKHSTEADQKARVAQGGLSSNDVDQLRNGRTYCIPYVTKRSLTKKRQRQAKRRQSRRRPLARSQAECSWAPLFGLRCLAHAVKAAPWQVRSLHDKLRKKRVNALTAV
jgi:hypothetical protein